MAAAYKTPGVYIEEISLFPPSVYPVETAVPAFVGYTQKRSREDEDLHMKPTRVGSLVEYHELFGAAPEIRQTNPSYCLYDSVRLYFDNGGARCYIVSVGDHSQPVGAAGLIEGLATVAKEDEPTLLVFPDAIAIASNAFYDVQIAALDQCGDLQDRFAILDLLEQKDGSPLSLDAGVEDFRERIGVRNLKYGAAYVPHLRTNLPSSRTVPPSGVIAGVYCRVDRTRGVHKAPANVKLNNVTVGRGISDDEQAILNADAETGTSINAIREFPDRGTLVWGARTLDGNSNEWRYVSVRRFFNMVEESTKRAPESFVFEPNDGNTWHKLRRMIESFLLTQWRNGALQGTTPEQAFYVKIGLGETMTEIDILEGRMIVEIGMAAVRPAEFIILRFAHKMAES